MGKLFAFVRGAALGAGCMYLFDPNLGKTRRSLMKDKAVKSINDAEKFVDKATVDLGNRMQGVVAEARSRLPQASVQVQDKMRPGPALIACMTGSLICLTGLRRRGIVGLAMLLGGAAMASRAANISVNQQNQTEQPADNQTTSTERKQRMTARKAA